MDFGFIGSVPVGTEVLSRSKVALGLTWSLFLWVK